METSNQHHIYFDLIIAVEKSPIDDFLSTLSSKFLVTHIKEDSFYLDSIDSVIECDLCRLQYTSFLINLEEEQSYVESYIKHLFERDLTGKVLIKQDDKIDYVYRFITGEKILDILNGKFTDEFLIKEMVNDALKNYPDQNIWFDNVLMSGIIFCIKIINEQATILETKHSILTQLL